MRLHQRLIEIRKGGKWSKSRINKTVDILSSWSRLVAGAFGK